MVTSTDYDFNGSHVEVSFTDEEHGDDIAGASAEGSSVNNG